MRSRRSCRWTVRASSLQATRCSPSTATPRRRPACARGADLGRRRPRAPRPLPQAAVTIFRRRFADVIKRQLDLFEREQRGLIEDCVAAERAYNQSDRDEAEERFGDYVDLV